MNTFTAKAPARANIIGEHTDYAPNGGHVLPTPLPVYTTVTVTQAPGVSGRVTISSEDFDEAASERNLDEPARRHWTDYPVGCLKVIASRAGLPALVLNIKSDVPIGCGISSSAALCVAVIRAVKGLISATWSDEEIALMAYEAEHDYVGVPCGKMDQFASSVGRPGQALLLNTRTLAYRHYPLPADVAVMLVDCGKRHNLAKGDSHTKRLERMAECIEARDRLGAAALCDLGTDDLARLSTLPVNVARRARHVITENLRVLAFVDALKRTDSQRQAELIAASHASQRDDFECSIPEIDALVASSNTFGVRGARLVGGGFGGAIMALVPNERVNDWWKFVAAENPKSLLISTYALTGNDDKRRAC